MLERSSGSNKPGTEKFLVSGVGLGKLWVSHKESGVGLGKIWVAHSGMKCESYENFGTPIKKFQSPP
jgi:hypothetical protein